MQEPVSTASNTDFRLALRFKINSDELQSFCNNIIRLIDDEAGKGQSAGMVAVKITRAVKHAIDLKFEDKPIVEAEHPVVHEGKDPDFNSFKANIVRGMFITFVEHPRGFPGFFDIVSGIAAAGLGIGKIKLPGGEKTIRLEEIKKYYPDHETVTPAQIRFFKQMFTPANLASYPNLRLGTYTILTGGALLSFYYASEKLQQIDEKSHEQLIEAALNAAEGKFSGSSECMQKFFSQNLFKVLFEELFTYESTVFSIFQ